LFEELLRAPREYWEAKAKKLDDMVENRRKLLDKIERLIAGHRLDRTRIEGIRKVGRKAIDEREVKRFVEVFVNYRGGRVNKVEDEISALFFRETSLTSLVWVLSRGFFRGSGFEGDVSLPRAWEQSHNGNVRAAMRDSVAVFRHPYLRGFIFFYRYLS